MAKINNVPLHRVGNKNKLISFIIENAPANFEVFIDLFAGSFAVSVAMAKQGKYVFANDLDDNVTNLYRVVKNKRDLL